MNTGEEWRPVVFTPGYEVSDQGRVSSWLPARNFAKPPTDRRVLKPNKDKDGYHKVVFYIDGHRHTARVATLVCEAWHGPRPTLAVVRHLDGGKTTDTPDNLVWGTPLENSADTLRHGTRKMGSDINTSRLTESQAQEALSSKLGHSELARKFAVTPCAIWHIRAGRSWKKLQQETKE